MVDKVIKHKGGADKEAEAMRKKVLEAKNELPERDGKIYYVSQSGDDSNAGNRTKGAVLPWSYSFGGNGHCLPGCGFFRSS